MIECPNCKTQYLDGTLFCEECGVALNLELLASDKRTDPLRGMSTARDTHTGPMRVPSSPGQSIEPIEIPLGSMALWIANSRRRQLFATGPEILIGRLDSANQVVPDLDLTADGGFEGGVSRRHSRIVFRDGQPYIEDLNSTNHTYLNGEALEPLMPYAIQSGDELRLGSMLLRVEMSTASE
ncbi:MAG: FHA domain-containing protein [Chloroflexi bacterium]|nr:FHA domain-containing protein [Chloroflexota bacterium]MBU1747732.1 FHA domain-containing protein [Chloroflexota bacterium]MBU1879048.1 FHA domain-containing protein [Chloroflexota bacterium]